MWRATKNCYFWQIYTEVEEILNATSMLRKCIHFFIDRGESELLGTNHVPRMLYIMANPQGKNGDVYDVTR